MRVVLINYRYLPEASPNAFRWSPVAEHWVRQGHSVDVVSALKPGLSRYEVIDGVRVHRVGGTLLDSLRGRLGSSAGPWGGDGVKPSSTGVPISPGALTKKVHDATWKKVYWPDHACLWAFPAARRVRQMLAEGRYDGVISISNPFTAHLVGLLTAGRDPSVSWTVDMGDPFSFIEDTPTNNRALYGRLNRAAEGRVFEGADAVAVTPQAVEKYAEMFPGSSGKMHALPLPLPSVEGRENAERVFPDDGKTRFVFIGSLYKNIRNPASLLKLFSLLQERWPTDSAELHFFGDVKDCWDFFEPYRDMLGKSIFVHGPVPRDRALRAVREANVVVNIANATPYQLPSKVMEYASLGKCVLNLAEIERDSSKKFFESYPAALNLVVSAKRHPSQEQRDEVIRFLKRTPSEVEPAELRRWLAPFRVEAVAAKYGDLLLGHDH